ncbi:ImmA/IrrE family metallo-endopeptidase [Chloroflexota bacterium]
MSEVKARQLAIDTRLRLGLQSIEHLDVYRAVNSLGITCVKRPLESSISGATLKTNRVKVILVNSSKSLGHQNFTIAHEIYHCLYDENLVSRACKTESFESSSDSEQVADLFATDLLMPEDAIFNQLRLRKQLDVKLTLADIISLEQFFSVSRKAMCWRLEDLKLISREQSDKCCVNVIQSARSLGKDTDLYLPTNDEAVISDYVEKAGEALQNNLITESRYEEILSDANLLEKVMGISQEADVVD